MNVEPFLALLDGVKSTGRNRWIAKCPSHEDKSPSLAVAEGDNGTILIRCWAGCEALSIVHAVGLELADLFPDRDLSKLTKVQAADVKMLSKRNDVEAALYTCEIEAHVLMQCALALQAGRKLSEATLARLVQAYNRVSDARYPIRQKHGTYPVNRC